MIQLHCYFFSAAVVDESLWNIIGFRCYEEEKNNKYVEDVHELDNATSDGIHVELKEWQQKKSNNILCNRVDDKRRWGLGGERNGKQFSTHNCFVWAKYEFFTPGNFLRASLLYGRILLFFAALCTDGSTWFYRCNIFTVDTVMFLQFCAVMTEILRDLIYALVRLHKTDWT